MSLPGWDRQKRPAEGEAHGWIQWKGTEVCLDFHCTCGYHGHFDGDFAYYLKCGKCGAVYMLNGHIELVPITADEVADANYKTVAFDDEYDELATPRDGESPIAAFSRAIKAMDKPVQSMMSEEEFDAWINDIFKDNPGSRIKYITFDNRPPIKE
jgi:hypothetical protein